MESTKLKKIKVGLDAGHYLLTSGKSTPKLKDGTFIHEAEQNYPVMVKVAEYLKLNGIDVVITNNNINRDISLKDRVKVSNDNNVDVFISIHKNAIGNNWQTKAKGILTLCHKFGGEGEKIARIVQSHLVKDSNMKDGGVSEGYNWILSKGKRYPLYVTKYTYAPAILLELGFMDNKNEALQMKDSRWHDLYAKAIVKGICEYFNVPCNFIISNNYDKEKVEIMLEELEIKLNEVSKIYNKIKEELKT